MPRAGGTSFRILHPDPFDFSRSSSYPYEICLAVEFASKTMAAQFEKFLMELPHARHIRLEQKDPFKVLWVMSIQQAFLLPKNLKTFPEISGQMSVGLRGYASDGSWKLPGR